MGEFRLQGITDEPNVSQTDPNDKYAGKSPQELADMLKEYESKMGQREQEFGELRKRVAAQEEETKRLQYEARMKEYYAQQEIEKTQRLLQQQEAERSARAPQVNEDEYDIAKPVSSTIKVVKDVLREEFAARDQREQQQAMAGKAEYAKRQYEAGFQRALKSNPEMLQGVEQEVKAAMYDSYTKGRLSPDDLGNEDMWVLLARNAKWYKGEQIPEQRPTGPRADTVSGAPVQTGNTGATPTQVRDYGQPGTNNIKFDDKTYEMMRAMNISEDEARRRILAEREGR